MPKRTDRLNSLLKEVISEVIRKDIHHIPFINEFIAITRVEITSDLHHAKVFVNIIGKEGDKERSLAALREVAGTIGHLSSKKVVMRYFPTLEFFIDEGLEKQLRIEELLDKIAKERQARPHVSDDGE